MRNLKMLSACLIITILIFILTLSNAKTIKNVKSKRSSGGLLRSPGKHKKFNLITCIMTYSINRLYFKDTLWCGKGNDADTCNDLGKANETDACCREHDNCPYSFSLGEDYRLGYRSNQIATISHCECDVQ